MQTANWYARTPIGADDGWRRSVIRARNSLEYASETFQKYEAALYWPPGMLFSFLAGRRGAVIWARQCRAFLKLERSRRRLSLTTFVAIFAQGLAGALGGRGFLRQAYITAVSVFVAQGHGTDLAFAPPSAQWTSIDSANFRTEEGVCYE
ncbi:MAG: hypothetical protein RIF32_05865 [Leptospirales bacterium]|jgi:hypothetical protein